MRAHQFVRISGAGEAGHCIVAFGDVAVAIDSLDLFVFGGVQGDRFGELDSPHRVRTHRNKGAITLLAFAERVVGAFALELGGGARGKGGQDGLVTGKCRNGSRASSAINPMICPSESLRRIPAYPSACISSRTDRPERSGTRPCSSRVDHPPTPDWRSNLADPVRNCRPGRHRDIRR